MFNVFDVPSWSRVLNPCYYLNRKSQGMIITVGDSWTYGDSLGKTQVRNGIDDTEYRLQHVYGNLISQELNFDWINLALPGISNRQMLTWLEQLLSRNIHGSNTTCIITLTESGRHEELQWLDKKVNLLQDNLESMVDKTYICIEQIQKRYPGINFLVAHNFTDSRYTHKINLCNQTWLEVLTGKQLQNNTHIVVSEHIKQMNYDYTYPDTPTVIDRALDRIAIMNNCKYCCQHDSRHPTEQGHRLWANYLLSWI